jgi:hypothetical protein
VGYGASVISQKAKTVAKVRSSDLVWCRGRRILQITKWDIQANTSSVDVVKRIFMGNNLEEVKLTLWSKALSFKDYAIESSA